MKSFFKRIIQELSILFFRIRNPKIELQARRCILVNSKVSKKAYRGGKIIMEEGAVLRNCRFNFYGRNNTIKIGRNCRLTDTTFWFEGDNNEIVIGPDVTMEARVQLAACEGTSINIGDDCMFSHDIYLRTTDSHPIYDKASRRINPAADITIGNHVWIGMQSIILKGSRIPNGAIIAARSLINKCLNGENSIYAGQPAKAVKEGISWMRK